MKKFFTGLLILGSSLAFASTVLAAVPTVANPIVSSISATSANVNANVTSLGNSTSAVRGVCYSSSAAYMPSYPGGSYGVKCVSNTGSINFTTGIYSVNLTGLIANTTYYAKAYAVSSEGVSYSPLVTFKTTSAVVNSVPTLTTAVASNITTSTASLGGSVTSLGLPASISSRGICYGSSSSYMPWYPGGSYGVNCIKGSGTTLGSYSVNLTGLTPNTTYYYKAYAINSTGVGYSSVKYSDVSSFKTLASAVVTPVTPAVTSTRDLTISIPAVNPNPTSLGTNTIFTGVASVNNAFTVSTPIVANIQIFKKSNGTGGLLLDTPINLTFANGSKTASVSTSNIFNPSSVPVGSYSARFCIDNYTTSYNKIAESNDSNNCSTYVNFNIQAYNIATTPVTPAVTSTRDLNIGVPVVSPSPTSTGKKTTFTGVASTNEAFTTVTTVVADLQIFKGSNGVNGLFLDSPITLSFAKGSKTASVSTYQTFSSSISVGSYSARFCIDNYTTSYNKIAESNDSNNCSTYVNFTIGGDKSATITQIPVSSSTSKQDLYISEPSLSLALVRAAKDVKFTSSVSSTTAFPAATKVVGNLQIYNGSNGSNGLHKDIPVTLVFNKGVKSVIASVNYNFPASLVGSYSARYCVDLSNNVVEFSEKNLCSKYINFPVILPDLTPVLSVNSSYKNNASSEIKATVKNIGTDTVSLNYVNTFEITDGLNGAGIKTVNTSKSSVQLIRESESYEIVGSFFPKKVGTYSIRACVDTRNYITESNEANNCSAWVSVVSK